MPDVRPAAVAGMFYPHERSDLEHSVRALVDDAARRIDPHVPVPKALVLPHAGYVYSGSTAALGYALLARARDRVRRVVLLGPTHRVAVDGLALPESEAFSTPLGLVPVEPVDAETRAALPQLVDSAVTHAAEHSLEVHLPFLQVVLDGPTVLPLAVGRTHPDQVADVLDTFWGGTETVVVVSSDLSHYLPYDVAARIDRATVEQILQLDGPLEPEQACGAAPVNGLLVAALRHGLLPRLLGMCSSGDTAGDRRRVVGYAAIGFDESARA
ncbi:AmmeMemoRadiSam system protein B [Actinotalea sp. M2MS4P-6]|uniref:AmmeMemoRadiSam system protein B n=1 Tax=Actinotalea sp. M2MS4P-6 TaxID=2983762 RepID=UPI0021E4B040|nr:AmmeMemoRadiSam system protein B [Actinotalea sp. M2MS4P-6]MCV2394843.1 AmmeMemoRadiSam system protein B [Actinotalea sp. M2MS4P-6]